MTARLATSRARVIVGDVSNPKASPGGGDEAFLELYQAAIAADQALDYG